MPIGNQRARPPSQSVRPCLFQQSWGVAHDQIVTVDYRRGDRRSLCGPALTTTSGRTSICRLLGWLEPRPAPSAGRRRESIPPSRRASRLHATSMTSVSAQICGLPRSGRRRQPDKLPRARTKRARTLPKSFARRNRNAPDRGYSWRRRRDLNPKLRPSVCSDSIRLAGLMPFSSAVHSVEVRRV